MGRCRHGGQANCSSAGGLFQDQPHILASGSSQMPIREVIGRFREEGGVVVCCNVAVGIIMP